MHASLPYIKFYRAHSALLIFQIKVRIKASWRPTTNEDLWTRTMLLLLNSLDLLLCRSKMILYVKIMMSPEGGQQVDLCGRVMMRRRGFLNGNGDIAMQRRNSWALASALLGSLVLFSVLVMAKMEEVKMMVLVFLRRFSLLSWLLNLLR